MKKKIILFVFLLIIPSAFSITFQELLDYYNFNFDSNIITIDSIKDFGQTVKPYNQLIIELNLTNTEGNYSFEMDLYKDNVYAASSEKNTYLYDGQNSMDFIFDPKILKNGNYSVSLEVIQDDNLIYDNKQAYSFVFDNTDFLKPDLNINIISHSLLDIDNDGKFDYLSINLNYTKNNYSTFYFKGDNKIAVFNGQLNYTMHFPLYEFMDKRIENPELFLITVWENLFYFKYKIDLSLDDIKTDISYIKKIVSDNAIDTNNNTLFDLLLLNLELEIVENKNYTFEFNLFDEYNQKIEHFIENRFLLIGKQNISLLIPGQKIYGSKLDGPYVISYIELGDFIYDDDYVTSDYGFDEFERPQMPDLVIENISFSNNSIKISVKNIGQINSTNAKIEIFNITFDIIETLKLNLSKNKSTILNLTYNRSIYAIIDPENFIEELNESNNYDFLLISFDKDNDNITDNLDNCPDIFNPTQDDFDHDTIGDLCDEDIDNDNYENSIDCEPYNAMVFPNQNESCDGIDNNCNILIDEDLIVLNGSDIGVCEPEENKCINGLWVKTKDKILPANETCNNLDDDCDGFIDENITQIYGSDIGECEFGAKKCINGTYIININSIEPKNELCDNLDNDCDGTTDDFICDKDNDGVVNELDLCSNSDSNKVDINGCTSSQFCGNVKISSWLSYLKCYLADWKKNEKYLSGDCTVFRNKCIADKRAN